MSPEELAKMRELHRGLHHNPSACEGCRLLAHIDAITEAVEERLQAAYEEGWTAAEAKYK